MEKISLFALAKAGENVRQSHLEPLLNCLKYVCVIITADEGDTKALGPEPPSTTDTMQVRIGITRQIVVDSEIDSLNIDTTAEDIGGHTDPLVKLFEFFVSLDSAAHQHGTLEYFQTLVGLPLFLADPRVNSDTREVALAQQLIEFCSTQGALDEDNNLIEF